MAGQVDCPTVNGSDPEDCQRDCLEVETCLVCGWVLSLLLTWNFHHC